MLQEHIISTVRKTMPSVVSILLTEHLAAIKAKHHPAAYPFFPKHQRELEQKLQEDRPAYAGGGSGFVIHDSGLIVTNKLVVSDAHEGIKASVAKVLTASLRPFLRPVTSRIGSNAS